MKLSGKPEYSCVRNLIAINMRAILQSDIFILAVQRIKVKSGVGSGTKLIHTPRSLRPE